jgi:glycosyltransferase involved in cell wall biosynthesis
MKNLRILHLVHQYPPHFTGGTELYTQLLAAAQVLNGHQAMVFCPSPETKTGEMPAAEEEQGVQVYRVPLGRRTRNRVFRDTFRQQKMLESLRILLQRDTPDIIHTQHLMGMPTGLIDLLVEEGLPYIVTLHDYWYVCANAQLLTNTDQTVCEGPERRYRNCSQCALVRAGKGNISWMAPVVAPVMKRRNIRLRAVLDGASRVIAPTKFVRQIYAGIGVPASNMVMIRHGIQLPKEKVEAARISRSTSKRDDCLRVGYIGSIGWQKGVHVLIEAVNLLVDEAVRLTLYGDLTSFPEYVAQLQDMIQHPGINLAGSVSRDNLWMALAEFDLVVMPTLWYEVSPLTIDEVFAVGVPIVASRIGAMSEKIVDGVNGRLFPPGDANALAQILKEIMANPALLAQWQRAIPPVRTIEDHVREIEELYQSTLDTV